MSCTLKPHHLFLACFCVTSPESPDSHSIMKKKLFALIHLCVSHGLKFEQITENKYDYQTCENIKYDYHRCKARFFSLFFLFVYFVYDVTRFRMVNDTIIMIFTDEKKCQGKHR